VPASTEPTVRIHRAVLQLPPQADWEPTTPETPWLAYWGETLDVVRTDLTERGVGCEIVLTQKQDEIPWTGDRTVAVMYGDILGQPGYAHKVAMIFQALGRNRRLAPSATKLRVSGPRSALVGWALTVRAKRHEQARLPEGAPVVQSRDIPLGTYNMVDVPIPQIAEREVDVAFDGSVSHWAGWWGTFQRLVAAPKIRHRQLMTDALEQFIAAHPEYRVRLKLRGHFVQAADSADTDDTPEAYSQRLAGTKIVVCPPGTLPLTFRHFEALRAGCVPVVLDMPDTEYLSGAPFVKVARWSELPDVLAGLLADPARLQRLSTDARRHWEERLAPSKVGPKIAAEIASVLGVSAPVQGGVA